MKLNKTRIRGLFGLAIGALAFAASAAVTVVPPNLSGGLAGSIPGSIAVGPDGSSQYRFEFPVPPGTAGIVPQLALQYASAAPADLSALGWSISGLSEITRCMKTRAQDGSARAVNLDAQDAYCLDGQRLILVSGTLGATAEFRTEVESFNRITSSGSNAAIGPDSWTVQTKSGMTMTYGGTAGNATLVAPGQSPILKWSIARSRDTHGNYVSYAYEAADGTGEHFITRVRYTGNDSAGLVPYNAVNFIYESAVRPDPRMGYFAGSAIKRTKRLQAIETRSGTATDGSGGAIVRRWNLSYVVSQASGLSLLNSIQDCDSGGTCLTPTSFDWTTRDPAFNTFHAAGSGVWAGVMPATFVFSKMLTLDADGDGKQDIIFSDGSTGWTLCKSTGTAFSCAAASGLPMDVTSKAVMSGDFNGDGKSDIFIPPALGSTSGQICLSSGTAFTCSAVTIPGNNGRNPNNYFAGDLDGDGYDDLMVVGTTSTTPAKPSYLCRSTGTTLQPCAIPPNGGMDDYDGTGDGYSTRVVRLIGDFNGDGRVDIVYHYSEALGSLDARYDTATLTLHLGTDTGFVMADEESTTPAFMQQVGMGESQFGDFNQDGYPDITWGGIAPNSTYRRATCLFNGKAFVCNQFTTSALVSSTADVNFYDGTGVASVNENFGNVHRMQPDGLPTGQTAWTPPDQALCSSGMMTLDFNGDGLPDVACYNTTSRQWSVSLTGYGSFADLLKAVTDGNGLKTSFTYKGLADPAVYASGSGTAYPRKDLHPNAPVVSRLSVDAASGLAAGSTLDTTYFYSGQRTDVLRLTTLGFESVTVTDVTTGVSTKTTYSQAFPTVGTPFKVETRAKAGTQLLSLQSDTLASLTTAAGVVYPYVRASTTTRYDLDGSPLPSSSMQIGTDASSSDGIDAYGNVTARTDTITDGADVFRTTTANVFGNTASTWMLGQLTDSKVTKSAPGVASVTREVGFTYDSFGRLQTQTIQPGDALLSLTTTFINDPSFGVLKKQTQAWKDPITGLSVSRDGLSMVYTDPAYRYPSSVTNAMSQTSSFVYDPATGQPTAITDPNALVTSYTYDGFGRRTRVNRPDSTAKTWSYRKCVDTCGYGGTAKAVTVTQEWATIAGSDQQSTVPGETFLDAHGRQVMSRSWDYAGNATYQDQVYDAAGRMAKKSSAQSTASRANGAYGWTTYGGYDALNRVGTVTTMKRTGTGVDTTGFQYSGLLTSVTDANLHTTKRLLNGLGKVKQVTDALNHVTSYVYDPFGQVLSTTDPAGNVNSIVVDALGRKTQQLDKDLGNWTYVVDAAGRVRTQKDAKAQVTTMSYDLLDRMIERAEPDLDSRWTFDTAPKGVGQLAEAYTWIAATSTKDYRRAYSYDSLSRSAAVTTSMDWDYTSLVTYDNFGRPATLTHRRSAVGAANAGLNPTAVSLAPIPINDDLTIFIPARSATGAPVVPGVSEVQYALGYNNQGTVNTVSRGGALLWTLNSQDATGRRTLETFASGLKTATGYNPYTDRLESIATGTDNGAGGVNGTVQNDGYSYDPVGNLLNRSWLPATGAASTSETFGYDQLNRLTGSSVGGVDSQVFGYDAAGLGNIANKTNVGTYTYNPPGSARPHMVASIAGTVAGLSNPAFTYDNNGNTVSGLNRFYTWSTANLPLTIDKLTDGTQPSATQRYEFLYGPERQRTRQIIRAMSGATQGAVQRTIYTAGAIEKEINVPAGTTTVRTYLPLGLGFTEEIISGTSIAPTSQTVPKERYFHRDNLGSLVIVTDGSGAVLERLGYDAWGRRRASNGIESGWQYLRDASTLNSLDRTGFSGQDQLDDLGLVHLNGRVYDPIVGRMTSPDPTIPQLYDLQSLNRASYVSNSPLNFVDPTGFQSVLVTGALGGGCSSVDSCFRGFLSVSVAGVGLNIPALFKQRYTFQPTAPGSATRVRALSTIAFVAAADWAVATAIAGAAQAAAPVVAAVVVDGGIVVGGSFLLYKGLSGLDEATGGHYADWSSNAFVWMTGSDKAAEAFLAAGGANSGGESASPPPPDDEEDAKQQTRGEKGKSFRGGKKADRDKWYGQDDKEFQRWWHREGKEEFNGGRDIEDSQNARAAREYWESLGRPRVK